MSVAECKRHTSQRLVCLELWSEMGCVAQNINLALGKVSLTVAYTVSQSDKHGVSSSRKSKKNQHVVVPILKLSSASVIWALMNSSSSTHSCSLCS